VCSNKGFGMTNIFTNFSSPVTSGSPVVPVNNSKTTVQDDKAIKKAYEAVGDINFTDMHFRKDIGIK